MLRPLAAFFRAEDCGDPWPAEALIRRPIPWQREGDQANELN
jgi:hypothetical protein